jgi:glycosyltransferase involved in cell wall biosynthesis
MFSFRLQRASRSGSEGAREIISGGETGLLVPVGAVDEMANAIASLLVDEGRRREFAARAKTRVAALFSLERMVNEVEELYESL